MSTLNQSIIEEILQEFFRISSDYSEEEQDRALCTFFLAGKEPFAAVYNLFSKVEDASINSNYFSIPMLGYYLPSNSLLYKMVSVIVAKSIKCLSLRSSHPRCLPLLNGIKHELKILQISRAVLEDENCYEALSKLSTNKLTIDADKMGNDLLKMIPMGVRELEINDFAFVNEEDKLIQNPKLHSIEKMCVREYDVLQDAAFDLPKMIAGYRKCFPATKVFDLIFNTKADRDSNILRHFYKKCIANIRKQNPNVAIRIYIDVEFVKDDPMPDAYKRKLIRQMEIVEGHNGAKKFIQISKKISLELFCTFQS